MSVITNCLLAASFGKVAYECHKKAFVAASSIFAASASLARSLPGCFTLANSISRASLLPALIATVFQELSIHYIEKVALTISTPSALSIEELQARTASIGAPTRLAVSELSRQIYERLREERSGFSDDAIGPLQQLRNQVDELIEQLAMPAGAEPNAVGYRAFMVLSGSGLRNETWKELAGHIFLEEDDFPFISLYLAAQGIYNEADLQASGIRPGNTSAEEITEKLKQRFVIFPRARQISQILSNASITVGKVFAAAFQVLGLYVAWMTFNPAAIFYGVIFLIVNFALPQNSSFAESSLFGKVAWVFRNSNPFCGLGAAIGSGLRAHSVQTAVSTYFS